MPYDPRYHQGSNNFDSEIGGYAGEEVTPHKTRQPVRHLGNTKQAIIAQRLARQPAIEKARARQHNGHGTQLPPDTYPQVRKQHTQREEEEYLDQGDDELYEDDEDLYTRPPRSAVRRYQPEEANYQDGNTNIYEGHLYIPKKRKSAKPQLLPAHQYQEEQYTEGINEQGGERRGYKRRIRVHWLVYVGIGVFIALILWLCGAWMINWWTNTQNDWTYTSSFRTYSTDAVVGHNHDSYNHPSHFIVQNDKRHIIIIELPADDFSKALIYSAPTLIGDGQEKTPVTISFQANTQTGRLDMVLHVQDTTYVFTNNGTKFITPQGQEGRAQPPLQNDTP